MNELSIKCLLSVLLTALLLVGCLLKNVSLAGGSMLTKSTDATVTLGSFDGSGTVFKVALDADIVTYQQKKKYNSIFHSTQKGSSYTIIYTFKGVTSGETCMTIQQRSPIAGNFDRLYAVKVDEQLHVTITSLEVNHLGM